MFSVGLQCLFSYVGMGSGHRCAGFLIVGTAWSLGRSRSSSREQAGDRRSSGGIVGEVCGVDTEGVPVQFLPVAENDRAETAAQTFPHGDSTMVSGEDLLDDGAGRFQQLVDQERQHHQQHQYRG